MDELGEIAFGHQTKQQWRHGDIEHERHQRLDPACVDAPRASRRKAEQDDGEQRHDGIEDRGQGVSCRSVTKTRPTLGDP